jgi:hypothetical protein
MTFGMRERQQCSSPLMADLAVSSLLPIDQGDDARSTREPAG